MEEPEPARRRSLHARGAGHPKLFLKSQRGAVHAKEVLKYVWGPQTASPESEAASFLGRPRGAPGENRQAVLEREQIMAAGGQDASVRARAQPAGIPLGGDEGKGSRELPAGGTRCRGESRPAQLLPNQKEAGPPDRLPESFETLLMIIQVN